ncbi:MAG: monovalent cation/H+ antiporter subunit D family protein [Gammaproteobacteria bacterium]|nr:monovalent cation/H+ antiporter subunit D family protein [Gammaproteobacteria bacterium]
MSFLSLDTMLQFSIVLPVLATLGIVVAGRHPNLREAVTITTSLVLLYFVSSLYQGYESGETISVQWWELIPGLQVSFKIEALGMMFALIASFLWLITTVYAIGYMRRHNEQNQTRFYSCFAIAIGSVMGIAFAENLFTLFIFYEILTLSTYPLVTHSGTDEARKGGRIYLGILLSTSIAFFLLAIVSTWFVAGTLDFTAGGVFDANVDLTVAGVILVLFIFGIGKASIMPFHRWLPAAMVAPTPVSALLHAVAVVKAGVFTVVKVIVYIFGLDQLQNVSSSDWMLYLSGFTIIVGSIIALRSDNLKRRLAYSTVSQLSYVIMATLMLLPLSVTGAALHILAHAFGKITLFFAAGSIYVASHKTKVSQLNGIGRRMPWTMLAFAVGSLSIIGLPPTIGFISKWYIVLGAMEAQQLFVIAVIISSTLLNASYFLPVIYAAFFKSEDQPVEHGEAPVLMVMALTTTAALTILLFFYSDNALELAQQLLPGNSNGK